jgi:hypothetical protein
VLAAIRGATGGFPAPRVHSVVGRSASAAGADSCVSRPARPPAWRNAARCATACTTCNSSSMPRSKASWWRRTIASSASISASRSTTSALAVVGSGSAATRRRFVLRVRKRFPASAIAAPLFGLPTRTPCASVKPSRRAISSWSCVSTPSAVVATPRLAPSRAASRRSATCAAFPSTRSRSTSPSTPDSPTATRSRSPSCCVRRRDGRRAHHRGSRRRAEAGKAHTARPLGLSGRS